MKEIVKYRFEYITGSLESATGDSKRLIRKWIKTDVTDILEEGVEAFRTRERKYLLKYYWYLLE